MEISSTTNTLIYCSCAAPASRMIQRNATSADGLRAWKSVDTNAESASIKCNVSPKLFTIMETIENAK